MLSVCKDVCDKQRFLAYLVREHKTDMALKLLSSVSLEDGNRASWCATTAICVAYGNQTVLTQVLQTYGLCEVLYRWSDQLTVIKNAIKEYKINLVDKTRENNFYKCINSISATIGFQFTKEQWIDILLSVADKYSVMFTVNFINNCFIGDIKLSANDWVKVLLPGAEDLLLNSNSKFMSKQMVAKIKNNTDYKRKAILMELATLKSIGRIKKVIHHHKGLMEKYRLSWDTIADMANNIGNVGLCMQVMKYCKHHKIKFADSIWYGVVATNAGLLHELILYKSVGLKNFRLGWRFIAVETIRANNIELFKAIIKQRGAQGAFVDHYWQSYIREAGRDVKLFEKVICCARNHKINIVNYPIHFLMMHEGVLGLLEFAVFSMEQGFFYKTGISDEILILAMEQQCKLYHYKQLMEITNMPSEMAALILQFTEFLFDKNTANYYPTISKIDSKLSKVILAFYSEVNEKNDNNYIKKHDGLGGKKNYIPKKRCIVM